MSLHHRTRIYIGQKVDSLSIKEALLDHYRQYRPPGSQKYIAGMKECVNQIVCYPIQGVSHYTLQDETLTKDK